MLSLVPLIRRACLALLALLYGAPSAPALAAAHAPMQSGDWVVWQVLAGAVLIFSLVLLGIGLVLERAARRRAEVSLGERLRFETLLSEQVATFSRVSEADVDRAIQRAIIASVLCVTACTTRRSATCGTKVCLI